jgi:hypothetical protein
MTINHLVQRAEKIVTTLKNSERTDLPGAKHLLITRLQRRGIETSSSKAIPTELFLATISREQLVCPGLTIAR